MNSTTRFEPSCEHYTQLYRGLTCVDLSQRTQLEMTGRDCAALLHNLCTQDIQRLQPGDGCEAFVTSVQGKVLGHILVFRTPQSLIVDTVPRQASALLAHLDRYLITEDAHLHDRTEEWLEYVLAGPGVDDALSSICGDLPGTLWAHRDGSVNDANVWLRRADFVNMPHYLLVAPQAMRSDIDQALSDAAFEQIELAALHVARIEHGFPLFGTDITDTNLPQEVDRNASAINFSKGCYLGQETVARLDALGHVNRVLRAFVAEEGTRLEPQAPLLSQTDDKQVGWITSVAHRPTDERDLALGYVRCEHAEEGTTLRTSAGDVQLQAWPITPVL